MIFKRFLNVVAASIPVALITLAVLLVAYAWPAIHYNGIHFVTANSWSLGNLYGNPVTSGGQSVMPGASYGILFLIVGTLASAVLALILALPLGIGAAVFLAEAVPRRWSGGMGFFVELLAAVPSVVYGLWGIVLVVPLLGHDVYPLMSRLLYFVPGFGTTASSGYGLLTSGIVLCLMIVPLITATTRDALMATEPALRESSIALGATRFETAWKVLMRAQKRIVIGAVILALGRALGETMAVLMVSGNALNYLPNSIYSPINTMAAFIAAQLDSALQDPTGMAVKALAEIAVILLVISLLVNTAARLLLLPQRRRK